MICSTAKYYCGDKSKNNELSLACNTDRVSGGGLHRGVLWGNRLEELCIDVTVLLNWMFNISVRIFVT